ncbi:MFS transporter [Saccharopolyspora soli]|uniref:MFS transporter n=1 Tax=Saccharopolyspora soli TaxID=2926618 RepID=UPI0035571B73
MSADFHQPLGALGLLLAFGVAAAVLSSVMVGRVLVRAHVGWLLSGSTFLSALGLLGHSLAPAFWVLVAASVLIGLANGAVDSGMNAYAANHFGARRITWMHASYGMGAVIGPAIVTIALNTGMHWRWAYAITAAVQIVLACAFLRTTDRWARGRTATPTFPANPEDRTRGDNRPRRCAVALSTAAFALQTGIESSTGRDRPSTSPPGAGPGHHSRVRPTREPEALIFAVHPAMRRGRSGPSCRLRGYPSTSDKIHKALTSTLSAQACRTNRIRRSSQCRNPAAGARFALVAHRMRVVRPRVSQVSCGGGRSFPVPGMFNQPSSAASSAAPKFPKAYLAKERDPWTHP